MTISLALAPSIPKRAPEQESANGQGDASKSEAQIVFELHPVRPKSVCGREKGQRREC